MSASAKLNLVDALPEKGSVLGDEKVIMRIVLEWIDSSVVESSKYRDRQVAVKLLQNIAKGFSDNDEVMNKIRTIREKLVEKKKPEPPPPVHFSYVWISHFTYIFVLQTACI